MNISPIIYDMILALSLGSIGGFFFHEIWVMHIEKLTMIAWAEKYPLQAIAMGLIFLLLFLSLVFL